MAAQTRIKNMQVRSPFPESRDGAPIPLQFEQSMPPHKKEVGRICSTQAGGTSFSRRYPSSAAESKNFLGGAARAV